jgi:hypothetical protein
MELGMESYPPALLVGGPVSASRMRARVPAGGGPAAAAPAGTGSQASSLRLAASPAGYSVTVRGADRPRNLQELAERVQLEDTNPWPAGASLPMGARGKVAHWTGTEWRGGASPGYTPQQPALPVSETDQPGDPGTVVTADGVEHTGVLPTSAAVEPPVQLTETPADTAFDTPDVQFPGDGADSPEELHR